MPFFFSKPPWIQCRIISYPFFFPLKNWRYLAWGFTFGSWYFLPNLSFLIINAFEITIFRENRLIHDFDNETFFLYSIIFVISVNRVKCRFCYCVIIFPLIWAFFIQNKWKLCSARHHAPRKWRFQGSLISFLQIFFLSINWSIYIKVT